MSGVKIDLHWSPHDDDIFATCGTSLQLYQCNEREGYYEADETERRKTKQTISHLASNTEFQFLKCSAWCRRPQPRNVFAVAQASGKVSIIGFGSDKNEDIVGKEFNVRFNRQPNFLAWNPLETNLLAEGLERNRNEASVLVWDVVNALSVEVTERTRHSFSEGPITKPYAELGAGEASSSFAWCPSDAKTFLVGMANKYLRLYDLRDYNKPRRETHHKCILGICFEPRERNKVASYTDAQIAIWDLRRFDRPITTITESKPVAKLSWCPTKIDVLSVLCKDSHIVKLHDIRHSAKLQDVHQSVYVPDEIEQASVERNIQPFDKQVLSSFAWHPTEENRLLAVLPTGSIRDMTIFERIALEWSSTSKLMMPIDKDTLRCVEEQGDTDDMTAIMRRRIAMGYGLQADDITANKKAVEAEPHLLGLWRWIDNIHGVISAQEMSNSKHRTPPSTGIITLLGFDGEDNNAGMKSKPVPVQWKAAERRFSERTHYRSPQRLLALQLCGWVSDPPRDKFESFIQRLVEQGEPERASAIALFYLHIKHALEILSSFPLPREEGEGKPNLQAVAMALSGFTEDRNTLWRQTCNSLRDQLDHPYLRAIFAFAASSHDNFDDVLNEEGMSVEDRVAFALNYLPDAKLKSFLCRMSDELIRRGDLDGILLTGMSERGIDLLEKYMDRTCDVQTAAVAAVFSKSAAVTRDLRVGDWIQGYRDLLDRWRLWHQRAQFDIARQILVPERSLPPQVHVCCNFCGKPVQNTERNILSSAYRGAQNSRPKATSCQSCRKALPRCAICLFHMDTLSGLDGEANKEVKPFKDWFTWCQTCRHGGHASHLAQWFMEHSDCPVTGCLCKCDVQDAVSRRVPRATELSYNNQVAVT